LLLRLFACLRKFIPTQHTQVLKCYSNFNSTRRRKGKRGEKRIHTRGFHNLFYEVRKIKERDRDQEKELSSCLTREEEKGVFTCPQEPCRQPPSSASPPLPPSCESRLPGGKGEGESAVSDRQQTNDNSNILFNCENKNWWLKMSC
jgi:hypothetical protein